MKRVSEVVENTSAGALRCSTVTAAKRVRSNHATTRGHITVLELTTPNNLKNGRWNLISYQLRWFTNLMQSQIPVLR